MSVILDFIPNGMSSIKFDKKVQFQKKIERCSEDEMSLCVYIDELGREKKPSASKLNEIIRRRRKNHPTAIGREVND